MERGGTEEEPCWLRVVRLLGDSNKKLEGRLFSKGWSFLNLKGGTNFFPKNILLFTPGEGRCNVSCPTLKNKLQAKRSDGECLSRSENCT